MASPLCPILCHFYPLNTSCVILWHIMCPFLSYYVCPSIMWHILCHFVAHFVSYLCSMIYPVSLCVILWHIMCYIMPVYFRYLVKIFPLYDAEKTGSKAVVRVSTGNSREMVLSPFFNCVPIWNPLGDKIVRVITRKKCICPQFPLFLIQLYIKQKYPLYTVSIYTRNPEKGRFGDKTGNSAPWRG